MKQPSDTIFTSVYEEYRPHVWRMARRFGVPREHIDDVTQEVWISAMKQLGGLDLSHPLKPWLTSVVWNHVRHLRRGFARQIRKSQALQDSKSDSDGLNEPVARSEAAWELKRLLDELPDEQREVLLLCDGEGLSAPEVSEALGVHLNTVYSRLRLARRRCQVLASGLGAAAWTLLLQRHIAAASSDAIPFAETLARAPDPATLLASATATAGTGAAIHPLVYVLAAVAAALAIGLGLHTREDVVTVEPPAPPLVAARQAEAPPITPPTKPPDEQPAQMDVPAEPLPPQIAKTPRKRGAPTKPVATPPPATGPRKKDALGAEHRIIAQARAALAEGTTSRALALLDEHRRDFPNGASAYTRDLLRYQVHCLRGDTRRALDVTRQYLNDHQFRELAADACRSLRE